MCVGVLSVCFLHLLQWPQDMWYVMLTGKGKSSWESGPRRGPGSNALSCLLPSRASPTLVSLKFFVNTMTFLPATGSEPTICSPLRLDGISSLKCCSNAPALLDPSHGSNVPDPPLWQISCTEVEGGTACSCKYGY